MEELKIELKENLGFKPPVIGYLASINEGAYSYNYYRLRHPGGIFNLQFNNVIDDFLDLLKHLKKLQSNQNTDNEIRLSKKFASLLSSFFKYYESCYEIILGCCKQHNKPSENEFIHKWLKRNGYSAGEFFHEKVKDDTSYFREMFNKLKHTSNTLRIIYFYKNEIKIFGYYLESAAADGSLGPDENLHPKHQDTHSANSLNFDLRRMYYCIYKVAETLRSALILHFNETYSIDLDFNNNWREDDSKLKKLYEELVNLPDYFFPNEFRKQLPFSSVEEIGEKQYLVFKIKNVKTTNLFGYKITFVTSGDSFSRSFRMPFYNPRP
ncbi:unnamed protein product [marine sediment metagenome]|uniref:Uncharacterized protein n=1 Tax=marine sediment metagenome TaxID=412755 RepID=X1KA74_9ZZZZ